MRVLDVGCGWGSFAVHAATRHGVHVTGITLSEPQAARARERAPRGRRRRQGRHPRAGLPRARRRALRPRRLDRHGRARRRGQHRRLRAAHRRRARAGRRAAQPRHRAAAPRRPGGGPVLGALRVPRRGAAAPVADRVGVREDGRRRSTTSRASRPTTRRRCATGRGGSTTASTRRSGSPARSACACGGSTCAPRGAASSPASRRSTRSERAPDRRGDPLRARRAEQDRVVVGVGHAARARGRRGAPPRTARRGRRPSRAAPTAARAGSRTSRTAVRTASSASSSRPLTCTASFDARGAHLGLLADQVVLDVRVDLARPDAGERRVLLPERAVGAAVGEGHVEPLHRRAERRGERVVGVDAGRDRERRAAVDEHDARARAPGGGWRARSRRSRPSSGRSRPRRSAPRWSSTAAQSSACWATVYGPGRPLLRPRPRRSGATSVASPPSASATRPHERWLEVIPCAASTTRSVA